MAINEQIDNYFEGLANEKSSEILNNETRDYKIPDLTNFYSLVSEYQTIYCIGDYDVDGIMSVKIMHDLCTKLQKTFRYHIPKRFSEGYGISLKIVETIPDDSLVITVDNGITCVDAITELKKKNCKVIILDHHIPRNVSCKIPDADIILDPKYNSTGWEFTDYCGAGICYKIAKSYFPNDIFFQNEILTYACLATVADSVPLLKDNRKIVKEGLHLLNTLQVPKAIKDIIMQLKQQKNITTITSDIIGYYIAPVINAPGRIHDSGGEDIVLSTLLSDQPNVQSLFACNVQRQGMVEEAMKLPNTGNKINCIVASDLCEGICGVVAGNLCTRNSKASFVLTDVGEFYKGSARCKAPNNVYNMLEACDDLLLTWGGHEKAAAFSIAKENVQEFITRIDSMALLPPSQTVPIDAIDIKASDAQEAYNRFISYEPYGEGFRKPLVHISGKIDNPTFLNGGHLKFKVDGLVCIGFGKTDEYVKQGNPEEVDLYGELKINEYKGFKTLQLVVKHLKRRV